MDESSDSHTHHPCMCARQRSRESRQRETKEIKALQGRCTPADQVILSVWKAAALLPVP